MAAKRRSTTPKRLDLDDGAVTHLHPDLLHFDFENPRLVESVAPDVHTESDLLRFLVPLTNVCKESKSSPRLNCVESATCESQQ